MAMREAFTVGIVLAAKDMYSGVMAKAQRNLGILRKTSTKSADAFEKSMKRFQAITAVGATMSVVSGQISGKIQEMTTDAIDFSDAMGKIGTVVLRNIGGFKSHQEAMEAWRTKGLDISTRSLYSASELINDVAYNLMSSGLKADTAMDLMESVSNTAIATIGDLDTTSALFGSIMNTFGRRWDMSALEKGKRIMNVLSGAVKKFTMTGNILAAGMSYATAAAESMNVPFEDTIAILGMLNTRGIEATKAGTAFMAFIRELPDATKKMGITIADANGKLLPMADILQNIEERLKGMKEIERTVLLNKALGEEGSKLIKILMGTSGELRENISVLQESGIAAQMVEERMKTLSAEVKTQEHRWQNLRIELGGKAAPVMLGLKKGVLELVDVLGEIPHAKAFAGTTLGIVGMAAEIGKTIGPALTMVGVLGMWRTQAALAATAQAALNKQMGIGAATAGTQATKMGIMGSKGGALVGVLGRVAAVGAAAFIGWEIGTILRDVLNLDEGVQKLLATLTGAKIGDEVDKEMTKASEIMAKLKKDIATEEEKKFLIKFEWEVARKAGVSYDEFIKTMSGRLGLKETEVRTSHAETIGARQAFLGIFQTGTKRVDKTGLVFVHEGEEIRPKSMAKNVSVLEKIKEIQKFQIGTKYIDKTGLALVHEGEEIKPKSMAGKGGATTVVHMGGVTINLKSAGSAQMDAYQIKRELDRLYNMEARRLP